MNTNMKHLLITLFLTVMVTSQSWSQDTWVKTFGGTVDGCGYSISPTSGGGLLITGESSSDDGDFKGKWKGLNDIFILELDRSGRILWSRIIGGTDYEQGNSVRRSFDGGVIITGYTMSKDGDFTGMSTVRSDIIVTNLDKDGRILWNKTIGGSGFERGHSVSLTSDGGLLVTGFTTSSDGDFEGMNRGGMDIFVIKVDRSGDTQWKRTFGGNDDDGGTSITSTLDGGVLVTGSTLSNNYDFEDVNMGQQDIVVLNLDSKGDMVWKRTFGGIESDWGESITTTQEGHIVVVGTTSSNNGDFRGMNHGGEDVIVMNLDRNGNVVWKKTLGGTDDDYGKSVTSTIDGDLLITGYTLSSDGDFKGTSRGMSDMFIIKLDKDGEVLWKKTYGGSGPEGSHSISTSMNDGIVITGSTSSNDGIFKGMNEDLISNRIFVMKLDSNGNLKPSGKKKSKKK